MLETLFFLYFSFIVSALFLYGAGVVMYYLFVGGVHLLVADRSQSDQHQKMHAKAVKSIQKASLGLLVTLALFVILYTLRNDMVASDPNLQAMQENPALAQCGDTPQNLCTLAHLKYLLLRP